MSTLDPSIAYVRDEDAPLPAAAAQQAGIRGWLCKNLFSSLLQRPADRALSALSSLWLIWDMCGLGHCSRRCGPAEDREACTGEGDGRLLAIDLGQVPAMDLRLLSDRPALAGQSRLSDRRRRR